MTPLHLPLPWLLPNVMFPTPAAPSFCPRVLLSHCHSCFSRTAPQCPQPITSSPSGLTQLHVPASRPPTFLHSLVSLAKPKLALCSAASALIYPLSHLFTVPPTPPPSHPVSHHPQGHLSQKRVSWWPPTSHPSHPLRHQFCPLCMPRCGFRGLLNRLKRAHHTLRATEGAPGMDDPHCGPVLPACQGTAPTQQHLMWSTTAPLR